MSKTINLRNYRGPLSVTDVDNATPNPSGTAVERMAYLAKQLLRTRNIATHIDGVPIRSVDYMYGEDANGDEIATVRHKNYYYATFISSGDLHANKDNEVDYLLVGGGGSGGLRISDAGAGGGGAGGAISGDIALECSEYPVAIGFGGAGRTSSGIGADGSPTEITKNMESVLMALGGGGGGTHDSSGSSGGCGGGAGSRYAAGLSWSGGTGSQGGDGGRGSSLDSGIAYYAGGGGGGIGGDGANSTYFGISIHGYGGNGGAGMSFSDIWPELTGSDLGLPIERFGGGGGGVGYLERNGAGTDGGTSAARGEKSSDATPNTGGGSGGAHGASPAGSTGNGGSGICIVRWVNEGVVKTLAKDCIAQYNDTMVTDIELTHADGMDDTIILGILDDAYPHMIGQRIIDEYDPLLEEIDIDCEITDQNGADILEMLNDALGIEG